jgi:hypothetical protein
MKFNQRVISLFCLLETLKTVQLDAIKIKIKLRCDEIRDDSRWIQEINLSFCYNNDFYVENSNTEITEIVNSQDCGLKMHM